MPEDLRARLKEVRLLCLDVDGVLSDGHLYYASEAGGWTQRFSVRDGCGIKLLQERGVEIAILSSGDLASGRARALSLGITRAFFGVHDKLSLFGDIAGSLSLRAEQAAFMGDELEDIPLLKQVGLAATVPEAVAEVQAVAHYVTRRPGGKGAVRELADLIRAHHNGP